MREREREREREKERERERDALLSSPKVPSRMFHSMVVVGNLLVIQGGLLTHQNQHSLEGLCPSNDVTIIDLSIPPTLCNGRPAITLNGMTYMYMY